MTSELKPCPFCESVPELPSGGGTQYEIECNGCGQAIVSVQICDLMTIDERSTDSFTNYRYSEEFIERAKLSAIEKWNTRAVPDVPELVRYTPAFTDGGNPMMGFSKDGKYVRHDQAAAVIAAKDDRLRKSEQDKVGMLAHIAELEAKLTQIEKQEVFGYVFTTPEYDAGGMTCFTKYKPASGNDNWYSNLTAVYAAPVASDADLRAANEDLRGHAARIIAAFDEDNDLDNPEKFNAYFDLKSALNPSEPRT